MMSLKSSQNKGKIVHSDVQNKGEYVHHSVQNKGSIVVGAKKTHTTFLNFKTKEK